MASFINMYDFSYRYLLARVCLFQMYPPPLTWYPRMYLMSRLPSRSGPSTGDSSLLPSTISSFDCLLTWWTSKAPNTDPYTCIVSRVDHTVVKDGLCWVKLPFPIENRFVITLLVYLKLYSHGGAHGCRDNGTRCPGRFDLVLWSYLLILYPLPRACNTFVVCHYTCMCRLNASLDTREMEWTDLVMTIR
jgi:hypothetical protein